MRDARKCNNAGKFEETLLFKEAWHTISPSHKHVLKIRDLKYMECPQSAITQQTWDILRLVNETTNGEGDILHLPFAGSYLDQPIWYRQAVIVVKKERAAHRREEMEKRKRK